MRAYPLAVIVIAQLFGTSLWFSANSAGDVLIILAKVTTWNTSRDEWAAEVAWQLEAEQRQ